MAGRFDKFLAATFPGLAARRVAARARLASMERLYDSIATQRQRPRRGSIASGNAAMDNAQGRLREYARWLDENHDLAIGVLDDLVSNIVGTGVGIEPMVRDSNGRPVEPVNDRLRDLWRDWWLAPEVTGEIPGHELERIICRSWLRDGELFIQHSTAAVVVRDKPTPYALVPLEADFVPFDMMADRTTHGVVRDGLGRPSAYYVYKQHPGDLSMTGTMAGVNMDTTIVSAANMSHLRFTRRLHQVRGASLLHGVFTRLDDLKDYEESERIAARVAAAFTAYVRKPEMGDAPTNSDGDRLLEMAPGMIFDNLLPGEEVGTIDTQRPNNDVDTYIGIQERRIAAGTGTRFSSIAKNYNGTYSAQRQELVEGAVHYRRLFNYLAERFYRPTWARFVDAALLAGQLRLSPAVDRRSLYYPELRAPSLGWIDPKKEVEAFALAKANGFRSRQQIIRDLGGDPREVDSQLSSDSFSPAAAAPPAVPSEESDDIQSDDDMEDAA